MRRFKKGAAMSKPQDDQRGPGRRSRDEEIAAEPPLAPLALPPDAIPSPVEVHLARKRRLLAVAGVAENGLVRPLDPAVKLPEHARVFIVTPEAS
jgi:hypothetical protein